jgi:hypothetical protein
MEAVERHANWQAALQLTKAARESLAGEGRRLRLLLEESRSRLHPLEDPFDIDLGVHRWLAGEREETYSDWLQWVIQQIRSPPLIYRVFGVPAPPGIADWKDLPPKIQREYWVPSGHVSQEGRLDLVVRFGTNALIVIEVKKTGAEEADKAKQDGYSAWLGDQQVAHKDAVLLATSAADTIYHGFRFVPWTTVCKGLRKTAAGFCKEQKVVVAAMILAFVAAVEQNLLGFSSGVVRDVCREQFMLFNATVVDYLEVCLKQEA